MKKIIFIFVIICALFGIVSCDTLSLTKVKAHFTSLFALDSAVTVIVSDILEKYPDSVDVFKQISNDIIDLSKRDKLTIDDIKVDISRRVADSHIFCKTDILLAMDKIFDKISSKPEFDLRNYRQELLDIASGIEWAIAYHEQNSK